MKIFLVESCQPVYEGDGPPRIVVGDIWDGKAEIYIIENEKEDFVDLMKAATMHRTMRAAMSRAEQRRKKVVCKPKTNGIIGRRKIS